MAVPIYLKPPGRDVRTDNGIASATVLQDNPGSPTDTSAKNDTMVLEKAVIEVPSNGVNENPGSKGVTDHTGSLIGESLATPIFYVF